MKQKRMVIGTLICGIACALCVGAYMQMVSGDAQEARNQAMSRYGGEQLEVCVATRDIAPGEAVSSSNTQTKLWLADLLPARAVQSLDAVMGKKVTSRVLSGEVIAEQRFEGSTEDLQVPEGFSALSIPLKQSQMVGGALNQGSYVSIYASGSTATQLIADKILVLAVSEAVSSSSNGWVTVAVPPEKTQELIASMQKEDLYIALPSQAKEGENNA